MKIHHYLFNLLLVLLPTQLAFHLWPAWAFIFGKRIDYLSPTLYLTDIFIVLILFFWNIEVVRKISKRTNLLSNLRSAHMAVIVVISLFITFNIVWATVPLLALYKWLTVFKALAIGLYLLKNYKVLKDKLWVYISVAIVWTAALVLLQFLNQGALGGIWYWLGERSFTHNTPGIALQIIKGQSFLRPYATFPHPNALAGSLILLMSSLFFFKKTKKERYSALLVTICGAIAVTLARSEAVFLSLLISTGLVLLPFYALRISRMILICIFASLLMLAYVPFLKPSSFPLDIAERLILLKNAGLVISLHPWRGIGLGNGILSAPRTLLQPVHNVFILLWEEIGTFGLLLVALVVSRLRLKSSKYSLFVLCFILITGLFDHYWLTLQQPMLTAVIVFCLSLVNSTTYQIEK